VRREELNYCSPDTLRIGWVRIDMLTQLSLRNAKRVKVLENPSIRSTGRGWLYRRSCNLHTITLVIQDRREKALAAEIERTQSELLGLGSRISAIKDADLTTTNDYIAAFAETEPIQKEYDEKLQKFSDLYSYARERDSHRGLLDIQRLRGNIIRKRGTGCQKSSPSCVKSTTSQNEKVLSSMPWQVSPTRNAPSSGMNSFCLSPPRNILSERSS